MAPSSFSNSSNDFSYDVFITFRGIDTRYGFTGNLYKALSDKGIRTFIDDKELQRGDEIKPSLLKNIEDSRIAIIVFSKGYAASSFCLDELVHIINYFKEKNRLVLPVFYDVEPSDVRHQTNRFGEALAEFEERFQNNKENMERLQKWKIALYEAANLSGYPFKKEEYEYEFITKIVTDIFNKIADHLLVGHESQLLQSQGSAVWVAAPGRDMNNLPTSSFYNLPPQGQHMTFAPTQAGHGPFTSIYHPAQAVTAATVHPLFQQYQTMAGAVDMVGPGGNVYQQPQRPQMNWPSNY